jgi:hypothetical protein
MTNVAFAPRKNILPRFFQIDKGEFKNLRRVVSAFGERVATTNPPSPFEGTANCPVLFHTLNEVRTTSRLELAVRTKQRTDANLIHTNQKNQYRGRNAKQLFENYHQL